MTAAPPTTSSQKRDAFHPDSLIARGIDAEPLSRDAAIAILHGDALPLTALVHAAGQIRRRYFGERVQVHMLHNVQCGACPEDCGYCGQAKTSEAPIKAYKLKSFDELSDTMKAEIDKHYPEYRNPPPLDDDRRNVTSWMYFKDVREGTVEAPDRK